MPAKLKNLEIGKVDFVDAGANQKADILLFKRHDEPAAVALQNKNTPQKQIGLLKRTFAAIAAAFGLNESDADAVEKGAASFDEKVDEKQREETANEMWEYCWLLQGSLCSIFWDEQISDVEKSAKMLASVDEFIVAVKAAIPRWVMGESADILKSLALGLFDRAEHAQYTHERVGKMLSGNELKPTQTTKVRGDSADMKIDKSKLTPEERAALEALEKKAGIPEETPAPPMAESAPPVAKASKQPPSESDDIYKGLHPAIKAELERLRKSADTAEERELTELAKKYEIIGKKPEELVPLLKSLKAAGGDAYGQMLAVLDASMAAVEKSGLFSELGKRGGSTEPDAWTTIEKHADEIQKANPAMSRFEAVDSAARQHPELVREYEKNR